MQRSNLKLEHLSKAGAPRLEESLDAWVWAERISVIGLFVLAVGYTLFVVHELFVPVVTALEPPYVRSPNRPRDMACRESLRLLLRRLLRS